MGRKNLSKRKKELIRTEERMVLTSPRDATKENVNPKNAPGYDLKTYRENTQLS